VRILGTALVGIMWTAWVAWSSLAIWFDGPTSRSLAGIAAGGLAATAVALVLGLRPRWWGLCASSVLLATVLAWWLAIPPSNDRDWTPEVAALPSARIDGERITVRNVRNFDYRTETDFAAHWEERSYDLSQLRGLDLFLSFWGPTLIAHTIMSWEFAGGQHLAISIETRRERGETYSAVAGFFRQFEAYNVVADERDLVGLRTNYRGEQVFLYRLRTPPARARAILLDYLGTINDLVHTPAWYNALTQNCTTTIALHAERALQAVTHPSLWNWRLLANGRLDELFYERGIINTSRPFAEVRAASDITARARAAGSAPDFSQQIRVGLPARPAFSETQ